MKDQMLSNLDDVKGHSVLIIDDDPSNLGAVSQYLDDMGLEPLVALDGPSGLEKARYAKPDLILLDVRLPGTDGFEICERLKTEEDTKDIPVIFMTALTKTEHKIKGFNAGGVDYITKPLQFEEVLARVATHLQLDDLRQRLEQKVLSRTAQLTSVNQKLRQEIAHHQQTAAALKASEARYRCLFEESPISLWDEDFSKVREYIDRLLASGIADLKTHFETHPEDVAHCAKIVRVLDVNKAALKLVGADSKEALRDNIISLFTQESLEVFREELITLASGGHKFQSEATIRKLTGEKIHTVLCLRVAPGYEDSLGKVMASLLDITDRKLAEVLLERQKRYLEKQTLELAQAKVAVETADRAKDRFLHNISHKLRTPLNPILGFSRLLKREPNLTNDQQKQIAGIERSGEHLLAVIEDIINFSQDNGVSGETVAEEFNLAQLIHEIRIEASDFAASKKLAFIYEEPAAIPDRVIGDEGKLKRVLQKLLDNAIKFTSQGGITLRVLYDEVAASKTEDPELYRTCHFRFVVADTGAGIAEEKLDAIFNSFTQAPSNGRWCEGIGLGLAICRQLVDLMGGTITVESKIGQGSTFTVALDMEAVT